MSEDKEKNQEVEETEEEVGSTSDVTERGGGYTTEMTRGVTNPNSSGHVRFVALRWSPNKTPLVNERRISHTYDQVIQYESKETPGLVIDLHREEDGHFDLDRIGQENLDVVKNETGFDIEYETKEGLFYEKGPIRVGDYQDSGGNDQLVYYVRSGQQEGWTDELKDRWGVGRLYKSMWDDPDASSGNHIVHPADVIVPLMTDEEKSEWTAANGYYEFDTYRRLEDQFTLNMDNARQYQLPFDKTLGELDTRYLPHGIRERFNPESELYDLKTGQAVEAKLVAERSLYAADFNYKKEAKKAGKSLAQYEEDLQKHPEERSADTQELEASAQRMGMTVEEYVYRDFPKVKDAEGQVHIIGSREEYESLVEASGFGEEKAKEAYMYLYELPRKSREDTFEKIDYGPTGLIPQDMARTLRDGFNLYDQGIVEVGRGYSIKNKEPMDNETPADRRAKKQMQTDGGNLEDKELDALVDEVVEESGDSNKDQYYSLQEAMVEAIDDRVIRGDTDGLDMGWGARVLNWVSNFMTNIRDRITGADPSDPDYRRIPAFMNNAIASSVEKKMGIDKDFKEYSAKLTTSQLEEDLDSKRRLAQDKLGINPTKALAEYKERHNPQSTEYAQDQPEDQPEVSDVNQEEVAEPVAHDPNAPEVLHQDQASANYQQTHREPLQEGLTDADREMVEETDRQLANDASQSKQVAQEKAVSGPDVN